jgi:hypothetical protein
MSTRDLLEEEKKSDGIDTAEARGSGGIARILPSYEDRPRPRA